MNEDINKSKPIVLLYSNFKVIFLFKKNLNQIIITSKHYKPLIQPIVLHVEKKDDFFIAENDTYALRCVGSNKRKIINETKLMLDYMVDFYIIQGDHNVTKQFKEKLENLRKIVDPSKRRQKWHWETDKLDNDE